MWVSRLRVNGGFLAGLDVPLSNGLNVVVGPRGVGKTTLLELIRHALGVPHADNGQARERTAAIRSLLGSGEVVLDVQDSAHGVRVVVDAEGNGRVPELSEIALMLGQNELEEIASSPTSRLSLIDLRAGLRDASAFRSETSEKTRQLSEVRGQLAQLNELFSTRPSLLADRAELVAQEQKLVARGSESLGERRDRLRLIETELIVTSGRLEAVERADALMESASGAANTLIEALVDLERLDGGVRLAANLGPSLNDVLASSADVMEGLTAMANSVAVTRSELLEVSNQLRLSAEPVRAALEDAEVGLGQITARLRNIDAQLAQLERESHRLEKLYGDYLHVLKEREALLDEQELRQESVYQARRAVADQVSSALNQNVTVVISHLAESSRFRDLLVGLLKGSNLQYRPLAEALSRDLLPRQLLRLVEDNDVSGLARAGRLAEDRAARIIGALQGAEAVVALSQVVLEDLVDFRLLDGTSQKSVEELSTGQKCAVTLPIVLTEHSRTLLLDQPEDHLDNAFLVQTVVTGLADRRRRGAQTIVATHNPNIPVLGSAEQVIALRSDGARGFVEAKGKFSDPAIVQVITSLMEGGTEAFQRRAEFYEQYGV